MTADERGRKPRQGDLGAWQGEAWPAPSEPDADRSPGHGQTPPADLPPGAEGDQDTPSSRIEPFAVLALTLAVLPFLPLPVPPGLTQLAAILVANNSLRRIRTSRGRFTGAVLARAARLIAIVHLAILIVGLFLWLSSTEIPSPLELLL